MLVAFAVIIIYFMLKSDLNEVLFVLKLWELICKSIKLKTICILKKYSLHKNIFSSQISYQWTPYSITLWMPYLIWPVSLSVYHTLFYFKLEVYVYSKYFIIHLFLHGSLLHSSSHSLSTKSTSFKSDFKRTVSFRPHH